MKAISVIEQPSVIRCILEHLELWEEEEPRPPPESLKMVCEPDADYVLPWRDDVPGQLETVLTTSSSETSPCLASSSP